MSDDDSNLIATVGPEFLGRLIDRHGASLKLYASQLCDSPDDVVQDSLVEMARCRKVPEQPVAWLYRAVRYRAMTARRSARRPELTEAFRAAGDTAMQLVACPADHQRRVAEAMAPEIPKMLGGGSIELITRGVIWAAIGVDTPPDTSLCVVLQSEDERAAQTLRDRLLESAALVAEQQQDGLVFGRFQTDRVKKAIPLLTPQVAGDRLTLTLDGPNGRVNAVLDALKPPSRLFRVRSK